ncbi:MAG: DUF3179 domain-containing protein [Gemmatimonadota bacterium]
MSSGVGDDGGPDAPAPDPDAFCSIDENDIFRGSSRDGIPALTDPLTTTPGGDGLDYLLPGDRVIGVVIDGDAVAVPLNLGWWHEIVNIEIGGRRVAVTHCPLTGSSLVFDREPLDGAEFGVSGLLYLNNLIMYDRVDDESLWPQMARGARCGEGKGSDLSMIPAWEMTWDGWRALHPDTRVVTSETGFARDYRFYPYGPYDTPSDARLLFPLRGGVDLRRPPKERVLGIPDSNGGVAYPFGSMAQLGPVAAIPDHSRIVFWDGDIEAAMAYSRVLDGETLSFELSGGRITDRETGSAWRLDGLATSGPLAGRRLDPVAEAYVAYWFAWAAFHRSTFLWGSE